MYILSRRDQRAEYETLTPDRTGPAPSFGETFSASFDFAQDEMLSISSMFNNQAFFDRQKEINKMRADGFNFDPYQNEKGELNYNRIAQDTGLIKSDGEVRKERNDMLAERRAYSQDVMDRGPGLATFAGMGTAMMFTDPINLATLPIGFGTAAKGLSVLGHTLRGARNTAAVAVASELAIQPLVFNHKHDINSPYEVQDAINVIGITAVTAGVLGGAIGGVSGYFTRAAERAFEESVRFVTIGKQIPASVYGRGFSIRPDPMQFVSFKPSASALNQFVSFTPTGKIDPRYRPTFESVAPSVIEKAKVELTGLATAKLSRGRVKAIEKEILELSQARNKLTRANEMINSTGKVITTNAIKAKNRKIRTKRANEAAEIQVKIDKLQAKLKTNEGFARAKADLNKLNQGIIPAPIQKEIDAILKQSEVAESARVMQRMADSIAKERGFVPTDNLLSVYKAGKDSGATAIKNKENTIAAVQAQIAKTIDDAEKVQLEELLGRLKTTAPEAYDELIGQLHKTSVDNDMAVMRSMVYKQSQASKPNIKPSDYAPIEVPSAPRASTTSLERAALDRDGVGKEFDNIMAEYNRLPSRKLYNEAGEEIDADDVIKAADDELKGLESVMRCSIG
jgi:hypothetical protein